MKHIPYGRHKVEQNDIDEITKVLKSNFLTQGPKVEEFEAKICDLVQAENGVAVNSATSALHIACLALDLKKGDYLWTSPNTFVASANCGIYCGAKVDFVDIEKSTGLMCTKQLETKLKKAKKESRLPKIVVPVHLCGTSCDMKRIKELSTIYDFKIIEDASHAIGGRYKEKPVGSCEYSDVTVFSFHPVKIITTGEGGMAMTNSTELAEKMKLLRCHGITKENSRFKEKDFSPWHYEQQLLGFNYRMNDIEAVLGISQANRINEIVKERNRIRDSYVENIVHEDLEFLEIPKNTVSSVHLVVARLINKTPGEHKIVFNKLRESGIGVQLHYAPVHLQPYYKSLGFKEGQYKTAEEYARSAISLPVYPGLKDIELEYICHNTRSIEMTDNTRKLIIGTAQWGIDYGISNNEGKTDYGEVKKILELAEQNNISALDTAKAYGDSEKVIGNLKSNETEVITKVIIGNQDRDARQIKTMIRASVYESYEIMGRTPLRGVLVHDPKNMRSNEENTGWETLRSMKEEGYIERLGLSIEDPNEAIELSKLYIPDIIQMPMNVFDQRATKSGALEGLKKRGIEIHIRSVFLQGLLLMNPKDIDNYFKPWINNIANWQEYCQNENRTRIEGALLPIIREELIDKFIVGIASSQQLKEILKALENLGETKSVEDFSIDDNKLINPSRWEIAK